MLLAVNPYECTLQSFAKSVCKFAVWDFLMLLAVNPYECMLQSFACCKLHGNRHCRHISIAIT
jgi:hypothetical protein